MANVNEDNRYSVWREMRKRCGCKKINSDETFIQDASRNYQKKNIKVCPEWANNFRQFCKDMGPRPSMKHSIDRIDNEGDYTPENCRWATPKEQANNTSANIVLEYKNKRQTVQQWADDAGITRSTFVNRLEKLLSGKCGIERRKQKVKQISDTNTIIYRSVAEASEKTGISQAAIRKCLCGHNNTAGGFKWEYCGY